MINPVNRISGSTFRGCLLGILWVLLWHTAAQGAATVERVELDAGAGVLKIGLNRRTEFKAMQLDAREAMVAFNSASLGRSAAGSHSGGGLVKQYTLEKLKNQVVSLMINTTKDIREVRAEWQQDTSILLVSLLPEESPATADVPVKRRKFEKGAQAESGRAAEPGGDAPETSPARTAEPSTEPARREQAVSEASSSVPVLVDADDRAALQNGTSGQPDFLSGMDEAVCPSSSPLTGALALCRQNRWTDAFAMLSRGIDPGEPDACQAGYYYLKAYSAYKKNTAGNDRLYLDAVSYFQDALSYYPDAPHAPFAMLALADIYKEIHSSAEAKGYFKLILKTYADHPVAAEALLGLGNLYAGDGKQELAIATYRKYLKTYPRNGKGTEVRLALGKSLYEMNEFAESLDLLSRVIEEEPDRVYKDPQLLVTVGNLNYQLGDLDGAREALTKAVNLFPDIEDVSVLLTRVGDTLKDGGQEDQAKKVYEMVMETYPDSDGHAISAIRMADLFTEASRKEAQYRTVMQSFPGHPMAKLAVIRLADLQQQAGSYSAGIETLRDMMSQSPKELKNEAEYVMASCFDGYFRQLAEGNDPLAVIAAYEKDRALVNRLDNSDIFESVGAAFFDVKLFEKAEELFQRSYKESTPGNRPARLYYRLAVTLQELGKDMQAREMFHAYFRKLPESKHDVDAYLRMARLLDDDESRETALAFIKSGLKKSESNMQKAEFLLLQAQVHGEMGRDETVPDLLIKAINLLASSPEADNGALVKAYRRLGEKYIGLSAFDKAADAFTMALNFSEGGRPPSLLYLLADANLKAAQPEAARKVFAEILGAGDDFWARMAEEQLRTMNIEKKLAEQGEATAGSATGEEGQ
jgi:TolA-binding protein